MAEDGIVPQNDLQCSHGVPWSQCPDREAHHEHPRPGTEPQDDSPVHIVDAPGDRKQGEAR